MAFTSFDYYLIWATIVGFIVFFINQLLYSNTAEGQIDTVVTITALLGGSLGILIGILLFERKPVKDNMMSRVFIACLFVIQVVIILIGKGVIAENITFSFWTFFHSNKWLLYYLFGINIVALILFAIDKTNACWHRSRIRIITLLGVAFFGGSVGSLLAMYLFRHKTRKDYFAVGVPLIIVMQIVLTFYLMNIE
jgi:uncharacterized membrane protein YsdA (DUF1294 family)